MIMGRLICVIYGLCGTPFYYIMSPFLSSTMEKWRNGDMVPGDGAMMVRLFW